MTRPVVDLPHPLSPTRPNVSPRRTSKVIPSTAFTAPTCRRISPRMIGKCFLRPSTCRRMLFSLMNCGHLLRCDLFDIHPTGDLMLMASASQLRILIPAYVDDIRTARSKRTTFRLLEQVGWTTFDAHQASRMSTIDPRQRPEETDGVGVLGIGIQVAHGCPLGHVTRIHHHDALRQPCDDAEIVGN